MIKTLEAPIPEVEPEPRPHRVTFMFPSTGLTPSALEHWRAEGKRSSIWSTSRRATPDRTKPVRAHWPHSFACDDPAPRAMARAKLSLNLPPV